MGILGLPVKDQYTAVIISPPKFNTVIVKGVNDDIFPDMTEVSGQDQIVIGRFCCSIP